MAEDLHATIAGVLAGFIVVSAAAALIFLGKYNSVLVSPEGGIAVPIPSLAEKTLMAADDKALLIGGAMLVTALVTVLYMRSLSLDDRDRSILGPLPIRRGTVVLAKLAAVTGAALVASVAINVLPALLFPVVVLMKTDVPLGTVTGWMCAHATAGMAGCAFVFLCLASLRALGGLLLPTRSFRWGLPVLQFTLVLAFTTSLLAMPVIASRTREALEAGSGSLLSSPHMWFLGLEEYLIGRREPAVLLLAVRSGGAVAAVFLLAVLAQVACFLRMHRFEPAGTPRRSLSGRMAGLAVRRVAGIVARDPRTRASLVFVARTFARSYRHRLYVAGAVGAGLAAAAATFFSVWTGLPRFRTPTLSVLSLSVQVNLVFFLVVGLRMATSVPADPLGSEIFRFHATEARERYLAGARAAVLLLAVLPLLVFLAPLHALMWGWGAAAIHFGCGTLVAFVLLELAFRHYTGVPLVSGFVPGRTLLSFRLPLYVTGYALVAYVVPAVELLLIERLGLAFSLVLFGLIAWWISSRQSARLRRDEVPSFDEEAAELGGAGLHL
jgi:hypothetical protein